MERIFDSGTQKRYSRALSVDDAEIASVINTAKEHIYQRGYKKKEYKKLIPFAKKILNDTSNKIEKAVIINIIGSIVFVKSGAKKSISFATDELTKMKGNILIHNHPSGNTLSFEDVDLAIKYGLKEIVAFSSRGVYYRLIIKDKENIQDYVLKFKVANNLAAKVIAKLVHSKVLTAGQANLEYAHVTMSLFAKSMDGIKYEKTKH